MTKATKWEYQYEFVGTATRRPGGSSLGHDPDAIRNALNRAGEEGWELVSMEPHWSNFGIPFIEGWYVTLKRPQSV